MKRLITNICTVLLVLGSAGVASAQSDGFALSGINFNFTNPGARARGIGGAFVAIADDSSAALANPAGLAYLAREVSIEWIHDEEEYPVGQLTHGGVTTTTDFPNLIMTGDTDPYRVRAESSSSRINQASLLIPLLRNKLTLSLYYGVLADLEAEFAVGDSVVCLESNGSARLPAGGEDCSLNLIDPDSGQLPVLYSGQQVNYSMRTTTTGSALGYRISDFWSIGASLALGQTSFTSTASSDGSSLGISEFSQVTTGDDSDLLYGVGVLYRDDRFGFGASWRSSSEYELDNRVIDEEGLVIDERRFGGALTVPDRAAIGAAWFPADSWVVAAEISRIGYSEVLTKMRPFDTFGQAAGIEYQIDDATEYHLGVEYTTFKERRGWSLRSGWWRTQTHLPYVDEAFTDPRGNSEDLLRAQLSLIRGQFEEDVDHFTVGFGYSTGVFRIDAAADYTREAGFDGLISGVFYF